jgi:hypothetical protein
MLQATPHIWTGNLAVTAYSLGTAAGMFGVLGAVDLRFPLLGMRSSLGTRPSADDEAEPLRETAVEAIAPRGAPLVGRWHHTSDGFKATPLMSLTSYSMPGYNGSSHEVLPFIRIGVCIACDPIEYEAADASQIRRRFAKFLDRDPIASVIAAITCPDRGLSWTPQAGAGVLRIDAVLGTGAEPIASAMLHLPVTDVHSPGRSDDMACLWLQVAIRGEGGIQPEPAGLTSWYRRFALVLSIAPALATLLSGDLSLTVSDQPAARVGVLLWSKGPMADLVDAGELPVLAGARPGSQLLCYAIASPEGKSDNDAARDFVKQLCESELQVDVSRAFLRAVGVLPEPGSSVQVPWEGGERSGTVIRWEDLEDDDPKVIVAVQVSDKIDQSDPSVMELAYGANVVAAVTLANERDSSSKC